MEQKTGAVAPRRKGRPISISHAGPKKNLYITMEWEVAEAMERLNGIARMPFNTWLRAAVIVPLLQRAKEPEFGFEIRPMARDAEKWRRGYECSVEERQELDELAQRLSRRDGAPMSVSSIIRHACVDYLASQLGALAKLPPTVRERREAVKQKVAERKRFRAEEKARRRAERDKTRAERAEARAARAAAAQLAAQ